MSAHEAAAAAERRSRTDERNRAASTAASACLFMVCVHMTMRSSPRGDPRGDDVQCYVMPWNCLDAVDAFRKAGARSIYLSASGNPDSWTWHNYR
jgi:hypothetical protein